MTIAVATLLAAAVLICLFAAVVVQRSDAFLRVHAVALVNVAAGAAMVAAVCLADGASVRTAKAVMIWLAMMASGAIGSHVAGRAIHLRGGDRR